MQSESKIQQAAFTYLRNRYPELYGCLYHVPNGGFRDSLTASLMTGQGLTPGVQDLHLVWGGKLYLIEIKAPQGEVSPEQKYVHSQHAKQGFSTYIFRSSEDIISFVESVLTDSDLVQFSTYISPYSDGSKTEFYREEMRKHRMLKRSKSAFKGV